MGNLRRIVKVGNSFMVSISPKVMREKNLERGDFVKIEKLTKVIIKDVTENTSQKKLEAKN